MRHPISHARCVVTPTAFRTLSLCCLPGLHLLHTVISECSPRASCSLLPIYVQLSCESRAHWSRTAPSITASFARPPRVRVRAKPGRYIPPPVARGPSAAPSHPGRILIRPPGGAEARVLACVASRNRWARAIPSAPTDRMTSGLGSYSGRLCGQHGTPAMCM
jgi:hypothetical protein